MRMIPQNLQAIENVYLNIVTAIQIFGRFLVLGWMDSWNPNDAPKFMKTCENTIKGGKILAFSNRSLKFIFCSNQGTTKIAHPVPAYMVVTLVRGGGGWGCIFCN